VGGCAAPANSDPSPTTSRPATARAALTSYLDAVRRGDCAAASALSAPTYSDQFCGKRIEEATIGYDGEGVGATAEKRNFLVTFRGDFDPSNQGTAPSLIARMEKQCDGRWLIAGMGGP